MDKNNYNNNEIDFEIDMDILQKKQLLEMSIFPVFGIS